MQEQGNITLEESISYAVKGFLVEEEDAVVKVERLSRIATDLRKQFEELKAQQKPSTPLEVIKERRKTTSEAIEWIKQGKKLFKEAIDAVSEVLELILEDEATEKLKEDAG